MVLGSPPPARPVQTARRRAITHSKRPDHTRCHRQQPAEDSTVSGLAAALPSGGRRFRAHRRLDGARGYAGAGWGADVWRTSRSWSENPAAARPARPADMKATV